MITPPRSGMTGIPAPVPAQPFGMVAHPVPQYDPSWNREPFLDPASGISSSGSDVETHLNRQKVLHYVEKLLIAFDLVLQKTPGFSSEIIGS